jgi:hypothetical protein
MFVTDQVIYIRLHRTASRHISMLLGKLLGGRRIGSHNRLPRQLANTGRVVVGSIRNPWDWYVSLWGYGCDRNGSLYGRLKSAEPFRDQWFFKWGSALNDVKDPDQFRQWLHLVHDPRNRFDLGESYGRSPISLYAGFYTYRYTRLFSRNVERLYSPEMASPTNLKRLVEEENVAQIMIRVENLEESFFRALNQCGIRLNEQQRKTVLEAGRTNASSRIRDLSYYYDAESVQLVGRRDQFLIEKYRYRPPLPGREYSAPDLVQVAP